MAHDLGPTWFILKVVWLAVTMQLNDYLQLNFLLPYCQSAYRERHSTETVIWSISRLSVALLAFRLMSFIIMYVNFYVVLRNVETPWYDAFHWMSTTSVPQALALADSCTFDFGCLISPWHIQLLIMQCLSVTKRELKYE